MAKINLISLEEALDEHFGKVGTPKRDAFERDVQDRLVAGRIGEAVRTMRQAQRLTQEELGTRTGMQGAQISKLERGNAPLTLSTIRRVFMALGVSSASLDLGESGKVVLW